MRRPGTENDGTAARGRPRGSRMIHREGGHFGGRCAAVQGHAAGGRKWSGRRAALALLLVPGCATLPSGVDPVPGSRPGLADDPVVVRQGSLQAEAGIEAGRLDGSRYTASELLLRYGVMYGAEARISLAHHAAGFRDGAALEDLELSAKLRLAGGRDGWRAPALALLPTLSLPTGAERLTAGRAEPGVLLLAGWDFPDFLEATANLGGTLVRSDGTTSLDAFTALAVGRELTDRMSVEMELVHTSAERVLHLAGGVAWVLSPDFQLDAWAAEQRHDGARGRVVGIGVSARLPEGGRR